MNKAILILKREYTTRVKKKSFIILTLLTPLLFAGVIGFSAWMSMLDSSEVQNIAVYDQTEFFAESLTNNNNVYFHHIGHDEFDNLFEDITQSQYSAILSIPGNILETQKLEINSTKQIPLNTQNLIRTQIQGAIESYKREEIYKEYGIKSLEDELKNTKTPLTIDTIKLSEDGSAQNISTEINTIIGFVGGFLIYIMIIIYGSMVMQGVIEEKTNRISEVLISTVKPMELMFGKIVGIGLVGLTQFFIWLVLGTAIFIGISSKLISPEVAQKLANTQALQESSQINATAIESFISQMSAINLPFIIMSFLFFFIFGYLLYASLMGAIGSSVSSSEDAQQTVTIATIPLILAIMMITPVGQDPDGSLAFWTSMIPLFSPICMMVRIPTGIATWEIILSASVLIASTIACIWIAGKIYRTGILMYGKKANLKEILRWIKQ